MLWIMSEDICKGALTGKEKRAKKMPMIIKQGEPLEPATGSEQLQAALLILMAYLEAHPE